MLSRFIRFARKSIHPIVFVGLILAALNPVRGWVLAQGTDGPAWVVRSLNTSEYGVNAPKGLAFSPKANSFLVLDGSSQSTLIRMDESPAGSLVLPDAQSDPLNAAFDQNSGGLYIFKQGQKEVVRLGEDATGRPRSAGAARFNMDALGIANPQGLTFSSESGSLYILDADRGEVVSVAPNASLGFDANAALRSGKVTRISLEKLGSGTFRGIAHNPENGHLYVSNPAQKKIYEVDLNGRLVSTFDLQALGIQNPMAMTFAPSVDNTDNPKIHDLFILDSGGSAQAASSGLLARAAAAQETASGSRIVELALRAPAALPSGTTVLPTSLVQIIDTSNAAWNPSSPDPSGIDYWPLTGRLIIADSEVEEMPNYYQGSNVYQSTFTGTLKSTCDTTYFSKEPTGVAVNPTNNHLFFSDDTGSDRVFELSLGPDNTYCTADDIVTVTNVNALYGVTDAEDVAYGNNTLFIAGGVAAEVYRIPLGANGVLGGGDDGAMTQFDTLALGFTDLEGIAYNTDTGTLFIVSTKGTERYMGETTVTGTLLRAYDLSLMGGAGNIRSGITFAPGSQNASVRNLYVASRGVDNNADRNENDGRVWEIALTGGSGATVTPSRTPTPTRTPTSTSVPGTTPTNTPPGGGPPGMATLVSPSGSTSSTQPAYTWNSVANATWYLLWINNPSGTIFNQWYPAQSNCSGGTCSVTPNLTLSPGPYTWWIQTWNSGGTGPWSSGMSFTVQMDPPPGASSPTSPSGSITTSTPTYTWSKVSTATWYQLWVNGPSGAVINQWFQSSAVCGGSSCSATPTTGLGVGNYTFWVRTWNSAGYGPWSSGMNFNFLPPAGTSLSAPSGSTSDTTPTYTWARISNATWYYLWVNGPSGQVIGQWYDAASVCGGSVCSATPGTNLSSGDHTAWVQTWNPAGYGPWSPARTFTIR